MIRPTDKKWRVKCSVIMYFDTKKEMDIWLRDNAYQIIQVTKQKKDVCEQKQILYWGKTLRLG